MLQKHRSTLRIQSQIIEAQLSFQFDLNGIAIDLVKYDIAFLSFCDPGFVANNMNDFNKDNMDKI
jgi:hypothetical protein